MTTPNETVQQFFGAFELRPGHSAPCDSEFEGKRQAGYLFDVPPHVVSMRLGHRSVAFSLQQRGGAWGRTPPAEG